MKYIKLVQTDIEIVDPKLDSAVVYKSKESGTVTVFFSDKVPKKQIWYTSSDGNVVNLSSSYTGEQPVVNMYSMGKGVMIFNNKVTSIGNNEFNGCTNLTSVTIPDSVTSIGALAFGGCSSLTGITIQETITSIGDYAFQNCSKLTSINIPSSVVSINEGAFAGCTSLTSIVIPDSVTSIGNYAFSNCTKLTSIEIPSSVVSIGVSAFDRCTSLSNISFKGTKSEWNKITKGDKWNTNIPAFKVKCSDGDVYLCNYVSTYMGGSVKYEDDISNKYTLEKVIITDNITSISESKFEYAQNLIEVTIANSVKTIGNRAFIGCSSLTSIVIPDSVTSIGDSVFANCGSLRNVTIGKSVESIGNYAFNNCLKLDHISIPDSITSIGDYAFNYCPSLTSGRFLETTSIKTINEGLFQNCSSLEYICIPTSVSTISTLAFKNCTALKCILYHDDIYKWKKITLQDGWNAQSLTKSVICSYACECIALLSDNVIAYESSDGSTVSYSGTTQPYSNTYLTSVGSRSHGEMLFSQSLTAIDYQAFAGKTNLTNISIPDNVTIVNAYAFNGCKTLDTVVIPESVTKLDMLSFGNCTRLKNIYYLGTMKQWDSIQKITDSFIKDFDWNYNVPADEVHCSDGTVRL